jgi:hypothetical protein
MFLFLLCFYGDETAAYKFALVAFHFLLQIFQQSKRTPKFQELHGRLLQNKAHSEHSKLQLVWKGAGYTLTISMEQKKKIYIMLFHV